MKITGESVSVCHEKCVGCSTNHGYLCRQFAYLLEEIKAANRYKTALLADMPQLKTCITCKHYQERTIRKKLQWCCEHDEGIDKESDVGWCDTNDHWEWRGPQEEANEQI